MALTGVDPRTWDLNQLLAAFEASLRQNAKDEATWRRMDASLRAEPKQVRDQRRADARAGKKTEGPGRMTMGDAEALMARFEATEKQYG